MEVTNSCLYKEYYFGKDDASARAVAMVLGSYLQSTYYTEMRTNQQLGYIVYSDIVPREDEFFGVFLIQSADYPARELERRSDEFLSKLEERFAALTAEEFVSLVEGVRSELEQKQKTIAEKTARFLYPCL